MEVILKCGEKVRVSKKESITLKEMLFEYAEDNQYVSSDSKGYSVVFKLEDISAIVK